MTSRYVSPLDALLDTGRREFDALGGKSLAAARVGPAVAQAPRDETVVQAGATIAGTAAGVAFRLKVR